MALPRAARRPLPTGPAATGRPGRALVRRAGPGKAYGRCMTEPVGVVLVSHSPAMAAGLAELLSELGSRTVPVALAAGTEDGSLGTSYDRIVDALAEADAGSGVVVLPDLGSSVLTAVTVLADHPRPDAVLVDAPFVEGAVAAVVTASAGAALAEVVAAAQDARGFRKL